MRALIILLAVVVSAHIALWVAEVFAVNFTGGGITYYGGQYGFLPSSGDETSRYDRVASFLLSSPRHIEPEEGGGMRGFLQFLVKFGPCQISEFVRVIFAYGTFTGYTTVQLLPDQGFGLWFKLCFQLGATGITAGLTAWGVRFLAEIGAFSNIYLLIALGVLGSVGGLSFGVVQFTGLGC